MEIREIAPADALARLRDGAVLVDVREAAERATGMADGAIGVPRAVLEADPRPHLPEADTEVLLICQSGRRSLQAAQALHALGYRRLASVAGGTSAWQAAGLPMLRDPGIDADFADRYSRHLLLPEVGLAGQQRLAAARVLLLGAGGLGAPAAY